ncbi:MAG: ferrous iron efflux protein F [Methanoregula sp. PtaU1.Bin051]|nr:MAG: ferrous iron efflux protein F [Methanoregula sp. PtaU1.Bin051]
MSGLFRTAASRKEVIPDTIGMNRLKESTARLSVASNTFLVIAKLAIGIATGSVSIISEAIHSGIDLIAAMIAFVSVRQSAKPADDEHTFGHGKFESMSGLIEAILIFVAAGLIIWESVRKIFGHGEEISLELIYIGILVMAVSSVLNWYVSSRLMAVAKKTESIALESDAWHLRTDVYTSLGIFTGLILIRLTGVTILDPICALFVAAMIIRAAYDLTRRSLADLMDQSLPAEDEQRIRQIICEHHSQYVNFHALRTRRSGPERFIDLHVCVPKHLSVQESHDFADHIEHDLGVEFPRSNVTVHIEPCTDECEHCTSVCTIRMNRK